MSSIRAAPNLMFAAVALIATPALAGNVVVRPGPGTPIQDAVNGASAGDRIILTRGRYGESVVVAGKNGLQFLGKGAVWGGNVAGVELHCLDATGDGIVVQGITFRNGDQHVQITGADARVVKCTFRGAEGDSLTITGSGAIVERNRVRGGDDEAITVIGDGARIAKNTIERTTGTGIDLTGNGAVVDRNRFFNIEDNAGIDISGDDAIVTKNNIRFADGAGIEISGAGARVLKNSISLSYGGVDIRGDGFSVCRNRVSDQLSSDGLSISGDDGELLRNRIEGLGDDSTGMDVSGSRLLIADNLIADVTRDGFDLSIDDSTVRGNTALRCSAYDDHGFAIRGDRNRFIDNQAIEADGDGFHVDGDANELVDCTATGSLNDGFDISSGTGNSLDGCTATNCDGEGLDNGATATIVRNCRFSGNRIDLANDGTFGAFTGNNVAEQDAVPQEDDGVRD